MFSNDRQRKIMYWTLELLLISILILTISQFVFILQPLSTFISTIFVPLLGGGFLYYLLNPFVKFLTGKQIFGKSISRKVAATVTFLLFIALVLGAVFPLLSSIIKQLNELFKAIPQLLNSAFSFLDNQSQTSWLKSINSDFNSADIQKYLSKHLSSAIQLTAGTLGNILGTITTFTINLFTIPVVLFYMMVDGDKLSPHISKIFSSDISVERFRNLTSKLNKTLEKYISGQVIEMLFVGTAMVIGYYILGVKYGLLLGVFAGITNVIPYLGPWLGMIPGFVVALTVDLKQAIFVIILVCIVQQLDGNLIYPNVIGKTMQIHPLTIIILLLASGKLWGVMGMILAVPCYAVLRTIIMFLWDLYKLQKIQTSDKGK